MLQRVSHLRTTNRTFRIHQFRTQVYCCNVKKQPSVYQWILQRVSHLRTNYTIKIPLHQFRTQVCVFRCYNVKKQSSVYQWMLQRVISGRFTQSKFLYINSQHKFVYFAVTTLKKQPSVYQWMLQRVSHIRTNHTFKIHLHQFRTQICVIHCYNVKKQPSIYLWMPYITHVLVSYLFIFTGVGIHHGNLLKFFWLRAGWPILFSRPSQ